MPSNIRADELTVKLRKRVIGCIFWVRNSCEKLPLHLASAKRTLKMRALPR